MIELTLNDEDRILVMKFFGKIIPQDFLELAQKAVPWIERIKQTGDFGVLTDLSEVEEFLPETVEYFKQIVQQAHKDGLRQQYHVTVFKDANSPVLKVYREKMAIDAAKSPAVYFYDYDKGYNFLKNKLKSPAS